MVNFSIKPKEMLTDSTVTFSPNNLNKQLKEMSTFDKFIRSFDYVTNSAHQLVPLKCFYLVSKVF